MEILSPLSKLLHWERDPKDVGKLAQSSRTGGARPSSSKTATLQPTKDLSATSVFRQLYTLPPKDLQRFVSQQLPFLNDPYFSKRLAHTTTPVSAQGLGEGEGLEKISDSYLVRDKVGGFWKVWVMPVALEGRLAKVTIYFSRKQQKKNREKNKSRIVLATELEHTGPIEIEADIFENSLLLALRSTRSFSALAQAGIRERFLQILEVVRLQGSIDFYTVSSLSMDSLTPETSREVEL